MTAVRNAYERLTYPSFAHPLADPARVAAVARVLGANPPDPARARVLDLGCGSGTHLLALAERRPHGRFFGVDFSAPDIAEARATAEAAGLANVDFQQADLMDWSPGETKFDYVIAYGLFSWVPDAVKERLLAVIAEALAPDGVAVVSYATYPGAKTAEALRDLLKLRTDGIAEPEDRVAAARGTLERLGEAWRGLGAAPHVPHLRDVAGRMGAKASHYLLLDDLGVERDPCYLMQFVGWAGEHGLRYLGDSDFAAGRPDALPPESAKAVAALASDPIEVEQVMDYVLDRAFRCSLLVGPEAGVSGGPRASAVASLSLGPLLQPSGSLAPGAAEATFRTRAGGEVTVMGQALVAVLAVLAERRNGFTPFADVVAAAAGRLGRTLTAAERDVLPAELLALYVRQGIAVSAQPLDPPGGLPARARLSPLNAALAKRRGVLVNPILELIRLEPQDRALCAALTDPVDLAGLAAAPGRIEALARAGCLVAA